ncbi:hypothetical protein ACGH7X_14810 [Streptomyces sp. BBFR51]|uniref:hypothetical protein n=1 Tax=Streptomyces sp. BBFR51 TaxID=3372856 RepID=UPI0037DCA4E2
MSPTELNASSRVTLFSLNHVAVAYTTRSSDERALGDIGLVAVVDAGGNGDELWRLARDLGGRTTPQEQARWILTQAVRARIVNLGEGGIVAWTAHISRLFELSTLFANHDILATGRIVLSGQTVPAAQRPDLSGSDCARTSNRSGRDRSDVPTGVRLPWSQGGAA